MCSRSAFLFVCTFALTKTGSISKSRHMDDTITDIQATTTEVEYKSGAVRVEEDSAHADEEVGHEDDSAHADEEVGHEEESAYEEESVHEVGTVHGKIRQAEFLEDENQNAHPTSTPKEAAPAAAIGIIEKEISETETAAQERAENIAEFLGDVADDVADSFSSKPIIRAQSSREPRANKFTLYTLASLVAVIVISLVLWGLHLHGEMIDPQHMDAQQKRLLLTMRKFGIYADDRDSKCSFATDLHYGHQHFPVKGKETDKRVPKCVQGQGE